ncbi:MAG: hypothetical protein H6Q04_3144 [Acidobacteria bacterium]|nr:hypothetical protein [Acidobacteriota bacterium]
MDLAAIACALPAAIFLIFIRAKFFPTNQIEWAIIPPYVIEKLTYSNFQWPQENSLALLVFLYLVFHYFFKTIAICREAGSSH